MIKQGQDTDEMSPEFCMVGCEKGRYEQPGEPFERDISVITYVDTVEHTNPPEGPIFGSVLCMCSCCTWSLFESIM